MTLFYSITSKVLQLSTFSLICFSSLFAHIQSTSIVSSSASVTTIETKCPSGCGCVAPCHCGCLEGKACQCQKSQEKSATVFPDVKTDQDIQKK